MGSIGLPEILVVLVVALVVLGPTKLPEAARQLGKAVAEFRRVSAGLQAEVRDVFAEPLPYAPPPPPASPAPATEGAGEDEGEQAAADAEPTDR